MQNALERANIDGTLILEPMSRNTAPAIAAAAYLVCRQDADAYIFVVPSDHVIEDTGGFVKSAIAALAMAESGWMSILGIIPREPSSAYGYIVPGRALDGRGFEVTKFVEKPSDAVASALIAQGAFWNAGMVIAKAADVIEALERHEPDIVKAVEQAIGDTDAGHDQIELAAEAFSQAPKISFDYAVLERHDRVCVTPLHSPWRDVGSWSEVAQLYAADERNNRVSGDVVLTGCDNSFVLSPGRLTVGLGIKDLLIIDTPDALLVAHRDSAAQLGETVSELQAQGREETVDTPKRSFAWGEVEDLNRGDGVLIRKLTIKPGFKTESAFHGSQGGHWIVLAGEGLASIESKRSKVTVNTTLDSPPGSIRQLYNCGDQPLEVVEVQIAVTPAAKSTAQLPVDEAVQS